MSLSLDLIILKLKIPIRIFFKNHVIGSVMRFVLQFNFVQSAIQRGPVLAVLIQGSGFGIY